MTSHVLKQGYHNNLMCHFPVNPVLNDKVKQISLFYYYLKRWWSLAMFYKWALCDFDLEISMLVSKNSESIVGQENAIIGFEIFE